MARRRLPSNTPLTQKQQELKQRENDLRILLGRPEGDLISRFPGLMYWRQDFESLYAAYSRFVSVEIDSTSGVSTLRVKAYRPEDAERVAQALLAFSEQLVNTLNERGRHDTIAVFQREVDDVQNRIAEIQAQLTAYRVNGTPADCVSLGSYHWEKVYVVLSGLNM